MVLSGPIAGGKSSLAEQLLARFGFLLVKTHELIRTASPGVPAERAALQKAGELKKWKSLVSSASALNGAFKTEYADFGIGSFRPYIAPA